MDKLYACALAFKELLDTEYHIIIGRKNKLTKIIIKFEDYHFHHLMGLGKLKDIEFSTPNRTLIFNQILKRKITYEDIKQSNFISKIENRFTPLSNIESILDLNNLVFKYNQNNLKFSNIQSEYLLSTIYHENEIYVFISKDMEAYFCRSFFPKEKIDYTNGQMKYTLLQKIKVNKITGIKTIQFNRLDDIK